MKALKKAKAFPNKLKRWLISIQKDFRTPLHLRLEQQVSLLSGLGLTTNRDLLIEHLNTLLREAGLPLYDENVGMYSEHLIIFAAISRSDKHKTKQILEIGTYDGKTTAILSRLFPNALITTIDLKDDDPIFNNYYVRGEKEQREKFISQRNTNLEGCKNVRQIQRNSLWLSRQEEQSYDLIWVDGAHGYPVVCCDITNSIRMLTEHGVLLCDDVFIDVKDSDSMYQSNASWETLKEYSDAGILNLVLLRKRLGFKHLASEKYVACSSLKSSTKGTQSGIREI